MLAPDQSPASPRRNALFGTCSMALAIASRPSLRSRAWQAFRRRPVIFEQVASPSGLATAFHRSAIAAQSSPSLGD